MSVTDTDRNDYGPFEDLERQQYEKLYARYDVPIMDIRKRMYKYIYAGTFILLALVFFLCVYIPIPNYLTIPIKIEKSERDQVGVLDHSVKIESLLASVGEHIEKESPICIIGSPEIQKLLSEIKSAENELLLLETLETQRLRDKSSSIASQRNNIRKQKVSLDKQLRKAEDSYMQIKSGIENEIRELKDLESRYKMLLNGGVVSKLEYDSHRRALINKQNELRTLNKAQAEKIALFNSEQIILDSEVLAFDSEKKALNTDLDVERGKLKSEIELIKNRLDLLYGPYTVDDNRLTLVSKDSGKLSFINTGRDLISKGEVLYRIESENSAHQAYGDIGGDMIGYVQKNMEAKIKLTTFPHFEWGQLSGQIASISESSSTDGNYNFIISIENDNPKLIKLLKSGQLGTASMVKEEKSVLGYVLSKFKKKIYELAD